MAPISGSLWYTYSLSIRIRSSSSDIACIVVVKCVNIVILYCRQNQMTSPQWSPTIKIIAFGLRWPSQQVATSPSASLHVSCCTSIFCENLHSFLLSVWLVTQSLRVLRLLCRIHVCESVCEIFRYSSGEGVDHSNTPPAQKKTENFFILLLVLLLLLFRTLSLFLFSVCANPQKDLPAFQRKSIQ